MFDSDYYFTIFKCVSSKHYIPKFSIARVKAKNEFW